MSVWELGKDLHSFSLLDTRLRPALLERNNPWSPIRLADLLWFNVGLVCTTNLYLFFLPVMSYDVVLGAWVHRCRWDRILTSGNIDAPDNKSWGSKCAIEKYFVPVVHSPNVTKSVLPFHQFNQSNSYNLNSIHFIIFVKFLSDR